MRRKDREMDENFAYYVADKCEWATVAVTDEKGLPYCFTISPAREEDVLYFHSALAGKKVDCLKNNPPSSWKTTLRDAVSASREQPLPER